MSVRPDPEVYLRFENVAEAQRYRRATGCGGWIFEIERPSEAWLFPPTMTPTAVFLHRITAGTNGWLW